MIIKIDDYDITELLLSYSRSMNMTSLIGNAAVSSLSISYDNDECQFGYAQLKSAIFEVRPTNTSQKYFFKAYEMPETYDGIIGLTLYDSLYEFDSLYKSTLAYPTIIKSQLDEMSTVTGIEIDYTQLDLSIVNKIVNENDNTLSMRDYLRWIAEIGGCNVFSSNEKYEKIIFKKVASTVSATCSDTLNYKKGNPYTISGIEFNNGQLSFSIGNQTSNIYSVSNDNPYVTSLNDLKVIENTLLGMTLDSATDVEIDYIDNLSLGDIIECPNTFKFIILDFIEEYVGGEYPDLKLSGELSTENSESVGNSVSNDVKIRLLKLQAKEIEAETLKVSRQIITLNLEVEGKANISDLNALKAIIDNLDVGNLEATYAKIDLSNVNTEHVGSLLVDSGLITDLTMVDGHVTGNLTGVRIHGDLITTNTLKVKDLLLEGQDGLIYQINALASGLSLSELTDEIYQQKLNGTDIVANSITATQIAGNTITADKINVIDLFAQDIIATGTITGMTLKGGSININDKFTVDSLGNGKFSGEIEATSGTLKNLIANDLDVETGQIANFNIDRNGLHITKNIQTSITSTYFSELDRGGATFANHDLTIGGNSVISVMVGESNQRLKIGYDGSIEAKKINGGYITPDIVEFYDSNTNDGYVIDKDGITFKHKEVGSIRNIITTFTNITKDIITSGGSILTNTKTSPGDGKAGGCLNNGNLYLTSTSNPYLYFYRNGSTTITDSIGIGNDYFSFSKSIAINNGGVRIANISAFGTYNSKGTPGNLIYCSSDDRVIIGTSATGVYGNTDIYAGDFMKFHANSNSDSYKATALELFREQSDNHRTVLRPATNSGAYLGTTTYRFNTAFFTNAITASDLKEKDVIEDFDFKVKDFIMGLEPIAYRRKGKGDTGERIHIGLGAQTLASHIKDLNLGDLSMVQASIIDGENEKSYHGEDIDDKLLSWGINYTELTPYLILMLKEQQKKIDFLEEKIKEILNKEK